jgi:hypothetical protein
MSSISDSYSKWHSVLAEDLRDESLTDENDGSASFYSFLNSIQLMKRVADEKLLESEKLQLKSSYLTSISYYEVIIKKIQEYGETREKRNNDPEISVSVPSMISDFHDENTMMVSLDFQDLKNEKVISILYSCYLNIACCALRCRDNKSCLSYCDKAITILKNILTSLRSPSPSSSSSFSSIATKKREDLSSSLLRAKYFKCFALIQLHSEKGEPEINEELTDLPSLASSEDYLAIAHQETVEMRTILLSSFPLNSAAILMKDYAELFSRIEMKYQLREQEKATKQLNVFREEELSLNDGQRKEIVQTFSTPPRSSRVNSKEQQDGSDLSSTHDPDSSTTKPPLSKQSSFKFFVDTYSPSVASSITSSLRSSSPSVVEISPSSRTLQLNQLLVNIEDSIKQSKHLQVS